MKNLKKQSSMKKLFSNWKTTSAGIVTIAGGVSLYINDNTKLVEGLTAVLAGIGLLFAHDSTNIQSPSNKDIQKPSGN